ncbi:MAG: cytochrome c3 family protein [Candidatus Zixiibacteriota bacterium]|nr:MAG: cytochrome c3 family protein [candidate division Zixibacteria bacterium]
MRYLIITILTIPTIFYDSAVAGQSSCINCHISSEWVSDTSIAATFMAGDIHRNMGLGCEDCHGGDPGIGFEEGDPELAMNPAKGYGNPPDRLSIPEFCGKCHSDVEYMKKYNPRLSTDQLKLYKTSVHGKSLYNRKDTKVAICTDCHGAHGILPSSDSRSRVFHAKIPETCKKCHSDEGYMRGYKYEGKQIPVDQYSEYKESVHGILVLEKGDNSAPACNDCHGNHGATPPNLASVSAACGECHANNRDFFNGSPHKTPWKEMDLPECEQCHGNHYIQAVTDDLLGVSEDAICLDCHDETSAGYKTAMAMSMSIDSLKFSIEAAQAVVEEAELKGVEGGQARFDLGSAKDDLIRVRSVIHTFDLEQVSDITRAGIKTAGEVQLMAEAALSDILIRQIGLAISLVVIVFIAIMIRLKIKKIDSVTNFEVQEKK